MKILVLYLRWYYWYLFQLAMRLKLKLFVKQFLDYFASYAILVILSLCNLANTLAILLPIKSPVASTIFRITLFEEVYLLNLPLIFLLTLSQNFRSTFLAKDKNSYSFTNKQSLGSVTVHTKIMVKKRDV